MSEVQFRNCFFISNLFCRLYSLLNTTNELEEVSVRRALLNPSGQFYKAILELGVVPGEGAVFHCPICNLTLCEESLMVSHLALRPHWHAGIHLKMLAGKRLRDLRCKLCHEQLRSQSEFWRHQVSQHFYDDLALQISETNSGGSGPLRCPARSCEEEHDTMSRAVEHLGLEHSQVEQLYQRFQLSGLPLTCELCQAGTSSVSGLKLHLATQHFSHQLLADNYVAVSAGGHQCLLCLVVTESRAAMLAHLGLVHNLAEEMYGRARAASQTQFQCSLCPDWRTSRRAEFLSHVTNIHCRHLVTGRTWVRDLTGAPVYRCDLCSQYFSTESLYLAHIGSEGPCHQSLPQYFMAVDQLRGLHTPALTGAQALARLEYTHYGLPTGRKFFRSFLSQLWANPPGNYVDPFSCDINLRFYNFNHFGIILQQPVHIASLKPRQRSLKGPFSCSFCDILDKEFDESDFIAYQIHLASHYSEQIQLFFGSEGSQEYSCSLCSPEEKFSHLQDLVGHLASQHQIILALYQATAPLNPQLICDKTPVNLAPGRLLLSSIFPWFPRGWPTIRNLTPAESQPPTLDKTEQVPLQSPYQCLDCLELFAGVSELMDHMAEMEHINPHWAAETNRDGRFVLEVFIIKIIQLICQVVSQTRRQDEMFSLYF